jgi:hypothetical protein
MKDLDFRDPAPFLAGIRSLEPQLARSDLPDNVKNLRTNSQRHWRELRQAAIFCYGMGQRIGQTVYLARSEALDYDFVAHWVVDDELHFAPVQLKEVPPAKLNPTASLQAVVDGLPEKYPDSANLTIAIHINKAGRCDLGALKVPPMRVAALWLFGATSSDQSRWGLWGNFLESPEGMTFDYPA